MASEQKPHQPKVRDSMRDATDADVRKVGITGSEQNKLRQSLYKTAWERIAVAQASENYLETICYLDSIMADRIFALVQTIKHQEDKQYPMLGPGPAVEAFFVTVKNAKISKDIIDERTRTCISEVVIWLKQRNAAVHGFVTVTPKLDTSVEERLEAMKVAAEEGVKLTKKIQTATRRSISMVKRSSSS